MTSPAELADRVEGLGGLCRETDLAIVAIVKAGMRSPWFIAPPSFTGSLDAAMTLVPDLGEIGGKRFDLYNFANHAVARCYSDEDTGHRGIAKTPALALCAAALRAMKP